MKEWNKKKNMKIAMKRKNQNKKKILVQNKSQVVVYKIQKLKWRKSNFPLKIQKTIRVNILKALMRTKLKQKQINNANLKVEVNNKVYQKLNNNNNKYQIKKKINSNYNKLRWELLKRLMKVLIKI